MLGLDDVVERAQYHPVELTVPHPLSYLYLEDKLRIVPDDTELERQLINPSVQFEKNVILRQQSGKTGKAPYPQAQLDHDPFSPALNDILAEKYDKISDLLLTQRDLKNELLRELADESVFVLIIVDGLGYADVRGTPLEGQPCLVNGPTTTPVGYKNVVYGHDETPLVTPLVTERGFQQVLGYSYWDDSTRNELNDDVFENINRITRIRTFDEVLSDLATQCLAEQRTYIQVSRRGLDGLVHDGKEVTSGNIEHEREKLIDDIAELCERLAERVDSYLVALTADHGILWRDDFGPRMKQMNTPASARMRYATNPVGVPDGEAKLLDAYGTTYTVFDYPYVGESFDADEAGTHGGLSYQESLVPFTIHRSPSTHE